MRELVGLELPELVQAIEGPSFRALQVFEWIYSKGATSFESMTNVPLLLRERLASQYILGFPRIAGVQQSRDGTTKYALEVGTDTIEAVHMPEEKRDTICISSQAGCSFGCKFCVTARMNLRRNLSAGEIVSEVLLLLRAHRRSRRVNIVFMGMGEPLHNYDNVMKAFRLMSHPRGMAISPRRITVSTVGFIPGLLRLKQEKVIPNLAVSLNAATDSLRNDLMPINRMYPLKALMDALLQLPLRHRQRITFEYVLLKDVNDSVEQASDLVRLTQHVKCKINLIPFNPDPHLPYERPSEGVISEFAKVLSRNGRTVAIRRSRGPDISAACGQLGTQYIDPARIPLALVRGLRV